jgi:hypothetical protein
MQYENYKGMFDFEDSTKYQINRFKWFYLSLGRAKRQRLQPHGSVMFYSGFVERTPHQGTKALLCGTPPSDNQWFAATSIRTIY